MDSMKGSSVPGMIGTHSPRTVSAPACGLTTIIFMPRSRAFWSASVLTPCESDRAGSLGKIAAQAVADHHQVVGARGIDRVGEAAQVGEGAKVHGAQGAVGFDLVGRSKGCRKNRAPHRLIIGHAAEAEMEDQAPRIRLQGAAPSFSVTVAMALIPGYFHPSRIDIQSLLRVGAFERRLHTIGIVEVVDI